MNKKLAGTGLAIGLVAGAGAGLIIELAGNAGAASGTIAVSAVGDTTPDTTGTSDTTATTGTGDSPDATRPDPGTRLQEVLKPLVDDGTITQDQADKVIAAIVAAPPADGPHGGPLRRPPRPPRPPAAPAAPAASSAKASTLSPPRWASRPTKSALRSGVARRWPIWR